MDKKNKSLQDIIANYQDIEMKLIESEGEIEVTEESDRAEEEVIEEVQEENQE